MQSTFVKLFLHIFNKFCRKTGDILDMFGISATPIYSRIFVFISKILQSKTDFRLFVTNFML